MEDKRCPVCDETSWDFDVVDGLFIYCGDCFHAVRKEVAAIKIITVELPEGISLSDWLRAIANVRDAQLYNK